MSKQAEISLNRADKHPYHGKPATDWAERAALGVLADLMDRSGIKHELRQIEGDEDVTDEIVRDLSDIIRTARNDEDDESNPLP